LLNKPIESICGYLTVLPGAFSAFRWAAVEVSGLSGLVPLLLLLPGPAASLLLPGQGGRKGWSSGFPAARPGSLLTLQRSAPLHAAAPKRLSLLLQGEPLRRYFYGLYSQNDLSAFEANMYLAEDRVLCLEIVARKNSKY
jgi:cellulose synthase/poly-beta-1,6-N-acetylglucosamine synthase-like glycosyltransferase